MACASCAVGKDGKPGGCNGNCSGGCNRMNTFDWLSKLDIQDTDTFDLVEVSFKNGSHKDFFHNPNFSGAHTGDMVLVEVPGGGGYDIGKISLTGDLVRLQLKKKAIKDNAIFLNIIRRANPRDLEKLEELRASERDSMIKARAITRMLDIDMKVGDVEYQGDGRKATFYYTADGRVDFRELIRHFAKEFKVKIEMRQIGARQESARVGGIGSCGRELCCSTWLSDFKSVSTVAARYQQLAINQAKLSGMCGRLKCCLNYELDTYLDALEEFPQNPERLMTQAGRAELIKTDVFKGLLTYVMTEGVDKGKFILLGVAEVKEVVSMNKRGEYPPDLKDLQFVPSASKLSSKGGENGDEDYDEDVDYASDDLVGAVELPDERRKKKKKKKKNRPDFDKKDGSNITKKEGPPPPSVIKDTKASTPPKQQKEAPKNGQPNGQPPKENSSNFKKNKNRRPFRDNKDDKDNKDK
jgi:cell fate regulator YaaT (PSP1 superfamily)